LSEESDPNRIRDVEIKRLVEMTGLAYNNAMDRELKIRTRESWYQKYVNSVLALDQLLKSSQYAEFEKRLRIIEQLKESRRTVLSPAEIKGRIASVTGRDQQNEKPSGSSSSERIG
jgi:hypothetical protein